MTAESQGTGRLSGKTAIVTGAASGFGKGIAERFAAEGASVAVVDIDGEGARNVAAAIGETASAFTADVSQARDVAAAVAATIARFGGIDVAVNNAGWSNRNAPVLETDEATFRRILDVNVMSIFHMVHAVLPHWRERGGGPGFSMINIGSTGGIRPRPGLVCYNTSKGAANLMSRALAIELSEDRIRVNCIAPVMGATGLLETFMGVADTPENRARFIATIPMGRMSTPADVASAALYLASDEAEFLTGVVLEVDGGRTI